MASKMNASAISYIQQITADPYPRLDYRVCHNHSELAEYLWPGIIENLGCDTESRPGGSPYCVTISKSPGTGRLIYAHDKSTLAWFRAWLVGGGAGQLLFHNYLHDVVPMGELDLPISNFTDTMVRAYNLCLGGGGDGDDGNVAGRGSLGLKQLSYRFLNMRMTSFKDTVFPYSIPHLKSYLDTARLAFQYEPRTVKRCQCNCLQDRHLIKGKRQLPHGPCTNCRGCDKYRAIKHPPMTEHEERLNRLYRKVGGLLEDVNNGRCEKDEEEDIVNPWVRVNQWHDYDHGYLKEALGQWPVPDIAHVPEPQLAYYAIRDSDATLRLYHFLKTHRPWVFYS